MTPGSAVTAVAVVKPSPWRASPCAEPSPKTTATEAPAPSGPETLTVRVAGTAAKVAVAATGPAVPAGSTQTGSSAAHDSVSGDSVQMSRRWPSAASAVSVAVDSTSKANVPDLPVRTIPPEPPAPSTATVTEPLAPALTVRVVATAAKAAVAEASASAASRSGASSTQGLASSPSAQDSPVDSVQAENP